MNVNSTSLKYIVPIAIFLVAVSLLLTIDHNKPERRPGLIFSTTQLINFTWQDYKQNFLESHTYRTLDPQRDLITTSEGQSYTLLRAVWMDDKYTFDQAFLWTVNNLGRSDQLFSWLFGERSDGTYGIITEAGGDTSATDADSDIAVALLFAYTRWRDESYLREARETINAIWEQSVVEINGTPYLAANNLEKMSDKSFIIVNPSYLSPYTYRLFAVVDPDHAWLELVDSSYEVINQSLTATLEEEPGIGLPPDWISIDKTTGEILPPPEGLSTNYGFDAFRTPWRLTLDWLWYGEPRAKATLEQMSFLMDEWDKENQLAGSYTHTGQVALRTEINALYAGSLGYFMVTNPEAASEIYHEKLLPLYDHDEKTWGESLSYYDANWVWFGIALYANRLPNLAAELEQIIPETNTTTP